MQVKAFSSSNTIDLSWESEEDEDISGFEIEYLLVGDDGEVFYN